jgi:hypothetical protein
MTSVAGVAELRPQFHSNPLPVADYQVPLMSLPGRLGVTLADLPNAVPYLAAPPSAVGRSVPRPNGTRLAIGLAWAGRPGHANDLNRSMALEDLLPLAELPGVAFYSLQTGPRAADIAACGAAPLIFDLAPQIQDFADTARLVAELDLVISVDTAVAHLAGALARRATSRWAAAASCRSRARRPSPMTRRTARSPSAARAPSARSWAPSPS